MLPYHVVNQLVSTLAGESNETDIRNDDLAHYLRTTPVRTRAPLRWRLLPPAVRGFLKARIEARRHENELIALWETSPHLLQDIGVILSNGADLPGHLVAAPESVIEHVTAVDPAQVNLAELEFPPKAQTPTRKKRARRMSPALFPAHKFS